MGQHRGAGVFQRRGFRVRPRQETRPTRFQNLPLINYAAKSRADRLNQTKPEPQNQQATQVEEAVRPSVEEHEAYQPNQHAGAVAAEDNPLLVDQVIFPKP